MFGERIPAKQLTAWLFAATTPVLIQLWSGTAWTTVAITAVACGSMVWLVQRWGAQPGRWLSAISFLYIIIVTGELLPSAAHIWPGGEQYPAVPLIILVLAAWSAQKGPSAAARVGSVLFWAVLLMYLVVFGAGVRSVRWEWLRPEQGEVCWTGVVLFLIPAAACALTRKKDRWSLRLALPGIFTVIASVITVGVMSPSLTSQTNNAFFEMSRSLELFSVARRFEAVISAGMTVGWFASLSLLLSLCGRYVNALFGCRERGSIWIAALVSAGWMLCDLHMPGWILALLAPIFWVLIPLLTQAMGREKKS